MIHVLISSHVIIVSLCYITTRISMTTRSELNRVLQLQRSGESFCVKFGDVISLSVKYDGLSLSVVFEDVTFSVGFVAVVELSLGLVFGELFVVCLVVSAQE